ISRSSFFIPRGISQSNLYTKLASDNSTFTSPKCNPGHILLPAPNGVSSKSCPFTSIELSKNLPGLNSSGDSHISGSLPIAHVLIWTRVLGGIS
ncbi:hypothetical protein LINPERHAP2_LOCUS3890, partial [Linum perenne]